MVMSKVIKELVEISHLDHEDIKTHILLARMFSEYSKKASQINLRRNLRAQALIYCKSANGLIDEYLSLQGIKTLSERDKERISFVKTISAIRLPLLK